MKHRITAFLTAISMCACSMPMMAQAKESDNTMGTYFGIEWDITDGVLTLEGSGDVIYEDGFPDDDTDVHPNWGYRDTITKIVFGEGVTYADACAFSGYPALETVVLSDGFTDMSAYLFKDCPNLREIQGLEHVEYFNTECLSGTAMMEEDPFLIIDGELRYCDLTEPADIVVPDGVTRIGRDAFGNLMLYPYEREDGSMYDIADVGFTITLPETVETIEEYAFSNLSALTGINIPDSVTEIGDMAFFNCLHLQSLSLGENVKKIGDRAFLNCKRMEELTVSCKNAQIGEDAFGVVFDTTECVKAETSEEVFEQFKEMLETEPDFFDILLFNRLDNFFGSMDYLKPDEFAVEEKVDAYGYVPEIKTISGYINSTAHYYAHEQNMCFVSLDEGTLVLGDVNGDTLINALDASVVLVEAANISAGGSSTLTAEQVSCADVNGDRAFNATDAAIILQYAAFTAAGGSGTITDFLK